MKTAFFPLLSLTAACGFFCVIITFVVTSHLYGVKICFLASSGQPVKSVQYLSMISLVSFIICLSSEACIIVMLENGYEIAGDELYPQIVVGINFTSWTLGQACIYGMFIVNLHTTFKNTLLEISKCVLVTLCILVSIFTISRLLYVTYWLLYYNLVVSENHFAINAAIIVFVTECVALILSIVLVYLFVNRLFKLFVINHRNRKHLIHPLIQESTISTYDVSTEAAISAIRQLDENATISVNYTEDSVGGATTTINTKQESILYVASKYAILSSIAIISTQLYLLSSLNNAIAIYNGESMYYYISFNIYCAFIALDSLINSLSICLNFEFSEVWFVTLCCLCDMCCHSICLWISKKCYKEN
eukprot:423707_1